MKLVNDSNKQSLNLDELIEEAFQKYDAVFFSEIDGQLFAYRPLGRKEYKDIITNESLDEWDKQDAICTTALFYPTDFDIDNCIAGIPDQLCNDIINKSCLDPESMLYLLHMNRQEASTLGSEMACIITEAFPSYTIEEVESWNNFKFIKTFAQAEWVLKNIRDVNFQFDIIDYLADVAGITNEELVEMGIKDSVEAPQPQPQQQQRPMPQQAPAASAPQGGGNGRMSAEQMKAYQDFVRQHPEFADAMQYDSAFTGFESQSADTVNPALRPGWYHNH